MLSGTHLPKTPTLWILLIVFLVCVITHIANSSIVDIKSPIVIYGDENGEENYFGYSLAFMRGYLESDRAPEVLFEPSDDRASIFIGAPNKTGSTKNSGVIWQCKFKGYDAKLSCAILSKFSDITYSNPNKWKPQDRLNFKESETKQFIGASLSTSESLLVAGAPRMKVNGIKPDTSSLNPCRMTDKSQKDTAVFGGYYWSNGADEQLSSPQDDLSRYQYLNHHICEYWYMFGEVGFSSEITSTGSVILGAPGNRKWSGEVLEITKQQVIGHNLAGRIKNVEPNSLLGYSVTSGSVNHRVYIASGAPRGGNMRGQVVVLGLTSNSVIYEGTQFGSDFGYTVATADVSGDGNDDLIIGAPLYTPDLKSTATHGTGCVFIYDVSMGRKTPLAEMLCLSKLNVAYSPGARFGSAICRLGDLNKDNRADFAVSAPYNDNGVGTVFIFYGNSRILTLAQVVWGKAFQIPQLKGFGTSLMNSKSTTDIDGNGTPDLGIGAFESGHVIVLRTRPYATLSVKITFHSANSEGENGRIYKLTPEMNRYRARICSTYSFTGKVPPNNLFLDTWQTYGLTGNEKRVEFENISQVATHSVQVKANGGSCEDVHIGVILHDPSSTSSIGFRAKVFYNDTKLDENITTPANLILSKESFQSQPNKQDERYKQAYKSFNPYAPAPIDEVTKTEKLNVARDNCDKDGDPNCSPNLVLSTSIDYFAAGKSYKWKENDVLTIGKLESLILTVSVTNKGETAYQPTTRVDVTIPEDFERSSKDKFPQIDSSCVSNKFLTRTGVGCSQTNPLQPITGNVEGSLGKMEHTFTIKNLKHLQLNSTDTRAPITVKIQAYPDVAGRRDQFKVEKLFKILLEEDVKIEVKTTNGNQAEISRKPQIIEFTQLVILKNSGYSPTTLRSVELEVPHKLMDGYGTEIVKISDPSTVGIECESKVFKFYIPPPETLMAKTNSSTKAGSNRKTRSAKSGSGESTSKPVGVATSSDKYIVLPDCRKNSGQVSCAKIICSTDLPSKGTREITLHMYLNKTIVETSITEETKGFRLLTNNAVVYRGKRIEDMNNGVIQRMFVLEKGVPAWVYLASGAGGTILFLLIAFALFKCGFFRRKTKEQLQQLKRKTMQEIDPDALLQLASNDEDEE